MSTTITPEEETALAQLREKIPDLLSHFNAYQQNEIWLLQWLRDRNLHVGKAETVLRKSLEWRRTKVKEDIQNWIAPKYIDDKFTFQIPGFDKDGCIICIIPFGLWNFTEIISQDLEPEFIRFNEQIIYNSLAFLEHCSTSKGQFVSQCVLIFDCEGYALSHVASKQSIDMLLEILRLIGRNCPDVLKAGWVVNAPKYFEVLFAVIRPLLGSRTLAKVHVHGGGGWREQLLENIEPDQLPSQYGGSNTTCPVHKVRYGFNVFKSYDTFPDTQLLTTIVIPAGDRHEVAHELSVGGKMSWNFRTDDYDLGGYSVEFFPKGGDPEEEEPEVLFAGTKIDSHLHLQKGAIVAERAGTYTLILDNGGSRFRGKTVYYAVRIE